MSINSTEFTNLIMNSYVSLVTPYVFEPIHKSPCFVNLLDYTSHTKGSESLKELDHKSYLFGSWMDYAAYTVWFWITKNTSF